VTALTPDDLRYLSMLAWRQGTRRAERIAEKIDAALAPDAGRFCSRCTSTPTELCCKVHGDTDDSWIPPYAREAAREAERKRQAEARKHFDVV
jgi:hypothetical protein